MFQDKLGVYEGNVMLLPKSCQVFYENGDFGDLVAKSSLINAKFCS